MPWQHIAGTSRLRSSASRRRSKRMSSSAAGGHYPGLTWRATVIATPSDPEATPQRIMSDAAQFARAIKPRHAAKIPTGSRRDAAGLASSSNATLGPSGRGALALAASWSLSAT